MNIVFFIICILILINAIRVRNLYVNYYNGFTDNKVGHFIGTFLWSCIEGACWWYVIENIIKYYNV